MRQSAEKLHVAENHSFAFVQILVVHKLKIHSENTVEETVDEPSEKNPETFGEKPETFGENKLPCPTPIAPFIQNTVSFLYFKTSQLFVYL